MQEEQPRAGRKDRIKIFKSIKQIRKERGGRWNWKCCSLLMRHCTAQLSFPLSPQLSLLTVMRLWLLTALKIKRVICKWIKNSVFIRLALFPSLEMKLTLSRSVTLSDCRSHCLQARFYIFHCPWFMERLSIICVNCPHSERERCSVGSIFLLHEKQANFFFNR